MTQRHPQTAREQFEAIWHAHYAGVFGYALRRLRDEQAADDVAADTFLVAWRRFGSVPDEPRPWLLGVARKQLANRCRGERRQTAVAARVADSVQAAPNEPMNEVADALVVAFNALSPADREVLSLISWEELKPREAAAVLGVPPARFSVRLHRARRRLRKKLELAGHSEVEGQLGTPRPPSPADVRMDME